jgi:hypothetical protein
MEYNSLSTHLCTKLNVSIKQQDANDINEGLLDIFKGTAANKAKGFFGIIGAIWDRIGDGDDKLTAALKEQERRAAEKAKQREEELANSAEAALIAKLNADFEQRENQIDLAHKQKKAAYEAQKKQFEAEARMWSKSNKRLFTAEQLEACNAKRNELYKGLSVLGDSELDELNQLATILTTDPETGNTLSSKEIKERAEKDSDLRAKLDKFNELAKKYKKPIIDSVGSKEFSDIYKQIPVTANEYNAANEAVDNIKAIRDDFEEKAALVTKFNEKKDANEKARKKLSESEEALSEFDTPGNNSYYSVTNNPDNQDEKKISIDKDKLFETIFNKDKVTTADEYIDYIKKQGVPDEILNKFKDKDVPEIKGIIGSMSDEDDTETKDKLAEAISAKLESKRVELQGAIENAKAEVTNNPEPSKDDSEFEKIKNMSKQDWVTHDLTSDAGKNMQKQLADQLKDAEKKASDIEAQRNANKEKSKKVHEAYTTKKEYSIPDEIKADVEKENSGLEAGESKHEGEAGVWITNGDKKEFVKKPGVNATDEEVKDYENLRDSVVLSKNLNKLSIHKIKKDGDQYYLVDGGEEVKITKEEAIEYHAENLRNTESRALILDRKQKLAENMGKCIKDGKLDTKAFKSLSPAERATIIKIAKGDIDAKEFFDGVDLMGSKTLNDVNSLKDKISKMDKEDLEGFVDDINNLDDILGDDWEDVEDNEASDEDDVDSDEDETYIDDEGEEQTRKKKIQNPAKIWKKRKKKNGEGQTKSYYNKEGESISAKEYKVKMEAYKNAKQKAAQNAQNDNQSFNYVNLGNHLFESIGNNANIYSQLRDRILNNLNS